MRASFLFTQPAGFDVDAMRAHLAAVDLGHLLVFVHGQSFALEVEDGTALTTDALAAIQAAVSAYVPPKLVAYSFPRPAGRVRLEDLGRQIAALGLPGFTGVSADDALVTAHFPGAPLSAFDQDRVAAVVAAYVFTPTWDDIRADRAPLLAEADWRIERAEDNGEDTAPLRTYRQALRDVTSQPNPATVVWPTAPW